MALSAAVLAAGVAAPARAADPGRWTETGRSTIPYFYYQGIASDPQRNLYFDGIHIGLYRTDSELRETARRDDAIPPGVKLAEGYNHIGDIAWDAREGGRLLLPVECYYPYAAQGQPDQHNTCRTGSFAVADPVTLEWRYYVKLDPAEIPKAMWVAVSPDGELAWTSSGDDLLAYRMDDVKAANAAPMGPRLKAVRRVAGGRPTSGITGAAFFRGRLYMAGAKGELYQVWSIDLDTGEKRLEIERTVIGESEGIDFFDALGGTLHWIIQPYNEQRKPPTYGAQHGILLHFVPKGERPSGPPALPARIRLSVSPRRVRAGRRARFRFLAVAEVVGKKERLSGARIRFAGRTARTDARGRVRLTVRLRHPGRRRASARRAGLRSGATHVRVLPRRGRS